MTALQVHTAKGKSARRPAMRVVSGVPARERRENSRRGHIVRPDRPGSRGQRILFAVPTAHSAAEAAENSARAAKWAVADPYPVRTERAVRTSGAAQARTSGAAKTLRRTAVEHPVSRATRSSAVTGQAPAISLHKVVVGSLMVTAAIVLFAVGVALAALMGLGPQAGELIYVSSGDTLLSIAGAMGVDVSLSQIVSDIQALNNLSGTEILAGQVLVLPAY